MHCWWKRLLRGVDRGDNVPPLPGGKSIIYFGLHGPSVCKIVQLKDLSLKSWQAFGVTFLNGISPGFGRGFVCS